MTERAERDDHVGARDDPGGKRRRPDFWSRPRRLLALAFLRTGSKRVRFGLAAVLGFALWAARTGLLCHGDADCWLGERQTIVATSKLSNKYDPSLAEQPVFVYDMGGVRALKFGAMGDSVARQSSAVIGDPDLFTLPIHCHIAAALLVFAKKPPRRVLMFGMGGGALHAFVQKHFLEAQLDVVDLEPEVVRLALDHFNVKRGPNFNVTIQDGRKWVDGLPREGLADARRYDIIVQDACAGHPCSLVTAEAIAALRDRALSPNGVLVQNLFGVEPDVIRTFQDAFSAAQGRALYILDSGYSSKALICLRTSESGPDARATPREPEQAVLFQGRARFLKAANLGPRCFAKGLRYGQTDDIASMISRLERADLPLLPGAPITDDHPDVKALEEKRWKNKSG
ncbi:S-adenosyl-L-methionine-dependent methyltransferase [Baffinella frigidus]|nr:S-adenosyl-L-methionine-dependent methyltransferase [Cryptophyta sp. CCMP2293]